MTSDVPVDYKLLGFLSVLYNNTIYVGILCICLIILIHNINTLTLCYMHVRDKYINTFAIRKPLFSGVNQYGVGFFTYTNRVQTRPTGQKEGLNDITAAQTEVRLRNQREKERVS